MARKFLVTYFNTEKFTKNTVETDSEEKFIQEGRLIWYVLSPQIRQEYFNVVHVTELHLRDRLLTVGFAD